MFDEYRYYSNRELSWLQFNHRVMMEAAEKEKPLLERLRFIGITASNLDEFFMVRVAGLKQQKESGVDTPDIAGMTPEQTLREIAVAAHKMMDDLYGLLRRLNKELNDAGIHLLQGDDLSEKQRNWLREYFLREIYPVITPLAVDASHPFPLLSNRSLNLAVAVVNSAGELLHAVVQVPGMLSRLVELPGMGKRQKMVFLEDVIMEYCSLFFQGHILKEIVPFRITRNADLWIEEDADDLLEEIQRSLRQRQRGAAVRLEVASKASSEIREYLRIALDLENNEIYDVPGRLDPVWCMKFADYPGLEEFRYFPLVPAMPREIAEAEDLWTTIKDADILLSHPYESFIPVVDFISRAARDPRVLAIKQILYRVGSDSPIVKALAQAAEAGKQVTVLFELKARFDEENNISWARKLEQAGCHVIYGLQGLKTHAKIALVVRREGGRIQRYIHIATGNYNELTAKIYTDIGLLTANDQVGADASAFFNLISGYSDPPIWNRFIVAPLSMREKLYELMDREISYALAGRPARIIAKMNALLDKGMIEKLYEASSAGVQIDLIVRGICVLRVGIQGISENITVRSIVGRFLEHSRIFYFLNDGTEEVYITSADWMPRNLNHRVELMVPLRESRHIERAKEMLLLMLRDNRRAYIMKENGEYRKTARRGKAVDCQEELLNRALKVSRQAAPDKDQRMFVPRYREE